MIEKVVVITGGPGTGKTTLIHGIVEILGRKEHRVVLAAPTGRAAKRLAEATGLMARTIHRLLEFNPITGEFTRNRQRPISADCLVIDEVSMLDVELAAMLLEAVRPTTRIVFVGDADQLPSVGPGNVLADLIASLSVPVIRLDQIFRQAERSLIVENAHRINAGNMPELDDNPETSDFFFIPRDDPKVQRLLASREDVFPNYTAAGFESAFSTRFEILTVQPIRQSARVLYLMRAKERTGGPAARPEAESGQTSHGLDSPDGTADD